MQIAYHAYMGYVIKRRPFFNNGGDWLIPSEIPFGGQLDPKLKPGEWWCWLLDNSDNVPKDAYRSWVGVPTTVWRIRKKLRKLGYE